MAALMGTLPGKLLAGVSGGADSVALLRLLLDAGHDVIAVHVDHGLRGAASAEDTAFVREMCEGWQVPLLTYRAQPPAHPSEDWARQVRYGFFRQAAQTTGVADIALAHHRDDQAETLLLHLLRGAGLTGLTGMQTESEADGLRILRPLLACSREELRAMLTARSIPWREDLSNRDPRYLRNALRLEVLPQLEALIPGAAERLARTAHILSEDEAVLTQQTNEFLAVHGGHAYLPLHALRSQLPGMQKRILRAWFTQTAGLPLTAPQTDGLQALLGAPASSRCNLPGNWHGQTGWTHLHLVSPVGKTSFEELALTSLHIAIEPYEGEAGDGRTCQAIPRAMLDGCVVRSRRPGDWLRPFGSGGRKSLQDELTDRRVDAPFRDEVPLLCRGSEVLLIGGVGAGDVPRNDTYDDPVLLRWTQTFPWQRG